MESLLNIRKELNLISKKFCFLALNKPFSFRSHHVPKEFRPAVRESITLELIYIFFLMYLDNGYKLH